MTFDQFMRKVIDSFPEGAVGADNDGQLIIYTNLQIAGDGYDVVPFDDGEPAH